MCSEAFFVFDFNLIFCRDWRKTLLNPSHIANDDMQVKKQRIKNGLLYHSFLTTPKSQPLCFEPLIPKRH